MARCCIIYNQPAEGAFADELDVLDQVELIDKTLGELGIEVYRKGITSAFQEEVAGLVSEKPDFIFNLVESINNKGELNYFVPALLSLNAIPYSGNSVEAIFITTNKVVASRIMKNAGLKNAEFFLPSQADKLVPGKMYIIKPVWEDGSMGITSNSVFTYDSSLTGRLKSYTDSHWFIEEYIDGREFNISILAGADGPETMPVAELAFYNYDDRPKIIDFKAKWELDSFEYENTPREFPGDSISDDLRRRLKETALACWHLFSLKGYARVDVRVDSNENIYIIEVNANPCISPDSGYVAATRLAGYEFSDVVARIINDLNR